LIELNKTTEMNITILRHIESDINTSNQWLDIGVVLLFILILTHIIFKLIFQKYFRPISLDNIIIQRLKKGKSERSDESENQLAWEYLDDVFNSWAEVSEQDGEVFKSPTSNKMLVASKRKLNQVIEIGSTDKDVIGRINEIGSVLNSNAKRVFSGSRLLVISTILVSCLLAFFFRAKDESFFIALLNLYWIWSGLGLYILSSFSPAFLIDKRIEKVGNYKIKSVLLAFLAALVLSGPTYYQIIHYRDETSSLVSDVGIFGLLVILEVVLAAGYFIFFFALLNYLRNFILYF
jgi:hypothetical protein